MTQSLTTSININHPYVYHSTFYQFETFLFDYLIASSEFNETLAMGKMASIFPGSELQFHEYFAYRMNLYHIRRKYLGFFNYF